MQGIYEIRNKINGKRYIGRSKDIDKRWIEHMTMLENGIHHSIKLQRAWNKYGKDNFEFNILKEVKTRSMLHKNETKYINLYDSMLNGYNMIAPEDVNLLSKKELKELNNKLLEEAYYEFNKIVESFNGKLDIYGSAYKDMIMNKKYNHRHYNSTCMMLNFALMKYGTSCVSYRLGYHLKKQEIMVITGDKNIKIYIQKDSKRKVYIENVIDLNRKIEYENEFPFEYKPLKSVGGKK